MTYPDFQIEPYRHDHDAGLAEMWNASDQQWPGGFTKGVPMTAERVADWMDKQVTVSRLVVSSPEGKVIGYGSLWDDKSQSGRTCYVDLLNVHPDYQGRSLCRRMLTKMVDTATERGYQRMTIGTWAANLKAVPLYKKVGFFWKPNTTVTMENYIPMLRTLPIAQPFFAQGDWYSHFDRELQQVEDEQKHPKTGAMEVYILRWTRPDGAWIEAVIDRKAQAITGLETGDFVAFARVTESKPAQGITYPITWEITNKRRRPISVTLLACGDQHVEITHESTFMLAAGETQTITSDYRCAGDAPSLDISFWHPVPTPQIKTRLMIDGEELQLGTGLQYKPAVEISSFPSPVTLMPGKKQTVVLQVKNHLDRAVNGELQIVQAVGVSSSWQSHPFSAKAHGDAGVPIELASTQENGIEFKVNAKLTLDQEAIQTAPRSLPILVRRLGSVAAIEDHPDPAKTMIYLENDSFYARCRQKEGYLQVFNKANQDFALAVLETTGPPYTPYEFDQKEYAISVRRAGEQTVMTLSIPSTNFPGLHLRREVIFNASPLVEIRQSLRNEGEISHTCRLCTYVDLPNNGAVNGQTVMPRRERLVTGMANLLPELEGDFPKYPTEMAEEWCAHSDDGQVYGILWDRDVNEHEWRPWYFSLISNDLTVAPGATVELHPFYLYNGPGDWRTVRRIWQQLNGETTPHQLDNRQMPVPSEALRVQMLPDPILLLGTETTVELRAEHLRKLPLHGTLSIHPPTGWQVEPQEVKLEALQDEQSLAATIHLRSDQSAIGALSGELQIKTEAVDSVQPFIILRLGDATKQVRVEAQSSASGEQWQIDNGRMRWTVAPSFHAGIVAWHEVGSEVNHLYTSYPEEGEFKWMKPWFGGLRPILASEEEWPGKLHSENFTASNFETTDGAGLRWQGMRLQAEIQKVERHKGLQVELEYLTLPGSNLLKAVMRVLNPTSVYRHRSELMPALLLYAQVDGSIEKSVLYGEHPEHGLIQRKPNTHGPWVRVGGWGAVVNSQTGRALLAACPGKTPGINLFDADVLGGHLGIGQRDRLAPHSSNELVTYLALAGSLEEARRYAVLGK